MRLNTVILLITLILLGGFTALNWYPLTYPHTLDLGFTVLRGFPIGLLVIGFAAAFSVLFVALDALNDLRQRAEQGRVLRQLEQVRIQLEAQENARFEQLSRQLEGISQQVQAVGAGRGGVSGVGGTLDLSGVYARLDKVRDELATDIAYSEDVILRELRGAEASGASGGNESQGGLSSGPSPLIRKRSG